MTRPTIPTVKPSTAVRAFSGLLAGVFFLQSVPFAHAAEARFWEERRRHRGSLPGRLTVASLPASTDPARVIHGMPTSSPRPALESLDLPNHLQQKAARTLEALPPDRIQIRGAKIPSGPVRGVLVHFQDVHLHTEAQENLGRGIAALAERRLADVVALEGAFDRFDLSAYARAEPRDAVLSVADHFLRTHRLSGPVHALLTSPSGAVPLAGIDDRANYDANVDAYLKAAPGRANVSAEIQRRRAAVDAEKARIYGRELADFDRAVQAHRAGGSGLAEYARAVSKAAPALALSSVRAFLDAHAMERGLDFEAVEVERRRVLEALVPRLDAESVGRLMEWGAAHRLGSLSTGAFYRRLSALCDERGVPLARAPALSAYVRYVLTVERLRADRLWDELRRGEKSAYDRLARTEPERDLARRDQRLHLLGKLVDFALTPEEWSDYRALPPDETIVAEQRAPYEDFYRAAERRDARMTENLLAVVQEGIEHPVLVTGGFHAEAMDRRLAAAGWIVLQATPRLTRVDPSTASSYLSVFGRDRAPLEKLFAGEKLFLSPDPLEGERAMPFAVGAWAGQAGVARALYEALPRPAALKEVRIERGATALEAVFAGGQALRFEWRQGPSGIEFEQRALRASGWGRWRAFLAAAALSLWPASAETAPSDAPGTARYEEIRSILKGAGVSADSARERALRRLLRSETESQPRWVDGFASLTEDFLAALREANAAYRPAGILFFPDIDSGLRVEPLRVRSESRVRPGVWLTAPVEGKGLSAPSDGLLEHGRHAAGYSVVFESAIEENAQYVRRVLEESSGGGPALRRLGVADLYRRQWGAAATRERIAGDLFESVAVHEHEHARNGNERDAILAQLILSPAPLHKLESLTFLFASGATNRPTPYARAAAWVLGQLGRAVGASNPETLNAWARTAREDELRSEALRIYVAAKGRPFFREADDRAAAKRAGLGDRTVDELLALQARAEPAGRARRERFVAALARSWRLRWKDSPAALWVRPIAWEDPALYFDGRAPGESDYAQYIERLLDGTDGRAPAIAQQIRENAPSDDRAKVESSFSAFAEFSRAAVLEIQTGRDDPALPHSPFRAGVWAAGFSLLGALLPLAGSAVGLPTEGWAGLWTLAPFAWAAFHAALALTALSRWPGNGTIRALDRREIEDALLAGLTPLERIRVTFRPVARATLEAAARARGAAAWDARLFGALTVRDGERVNVYADAALAGTWGRWEFLGRVLRPLVWHHESLRVRRLLRASGPVPRMPFMAIGEPVSFLRRLLSRAEPEKDPVAMLRAYYSPMTGDPQSIIEIHKRVLSDSRKRVFPWPLLLNTLVHANHLAEASVAFHEDDANGIEVFNLDDRVINGVPDAEALYDGLAALARWWIENGGPKRLDQPTEEDVWTLYTIARGLDPRVHAENGDALSRPEFRRLLRSLGDGPGGVALLEEIDRWNGHVSGSTTWGKRGLLWPWETRERELSGADFLFEDVWDSDEGVGSSVPIGLQRLYARDPGLAASPITPPRWGEMYARLVGRSSDHVFDLSEFFALLGHKYVTRRFFEGLLEQPRVLASVDPDPDELEKIRTVAGEPLVTITIPAFLHPAHRRSVRELAADIAGDRLDLPAIYKSNAGKLGFNNIVIDRSGDGVRLTLSFLEHAEARRFGPARRIVSYLTNRYPLGARGQGPVRYRVVPGKSVYEIELPAPISIEALVEIINRLASPGAITYDTGMVEEFRLDLLRPRGSAYETRLLLSGRLSDRSVEWRKSSRDYPDFHAPGSFARQGVSAYFAGEGGLEVNIPYPRMFDPLSGLVPALRTAEGRQRFEDYVQSEMNRVFDGLSARLLSLGVPADLFLQMEMDLMWLSPGPGEEFPRPLLLEAKFNPMFESGRDRERRIAVSFLPTESTRRPNSVVYRLARALGALGGDRKRAESTRRVAGWIERQAPRLGLWGLIGEVPALLVASVALGPVGAMAGFAVFTAAHVLLEAWESGVGSRGPPAPWTTRLAEAFRKGFAPQFIRFALAYLPVALVGPAPLAVGWAVGAHVAYDATRMGSHDPSRPAWRRPAVLVAAVMSLALAAGLGAGVDGGAWHAALPLVVAGGLSSRSRAIVFPGLLVPVNVLDVGSRVRDGRLISEGGLSKIRRLLPELERAGAGGVYLYNGLYTPSRLGTLVHTVPNAGDHVLESGPVKVLVGNYDTKRAVGRAWERGRPIGVPLSDAYGNNFSVDMTRLNPAAFRGRTESERWSELADFTGEAHRRGLSVTVDLVPWLSPDALTESNYEWARRRFEVRGAPEDWTDERLLAENRDYALLRIERNGRSTRAMVGHFMPGKDQIEPDFGHPGYRRFLINHLRRLVDAGVDRVRVDMAHRLRAADAESTWLAWREVIDSTKEYAARRGRTFHFLMEAYDEGGDRWREAFTDRFPEESAYAVELFQAYERLAGGDERGLIPLREALEAARRRPGAFTVYPSNFDERALRNVGGPTEAFLAMLLTYERLGVPLMVDLREWLDEEGHNIPQAGGQDRDGDNFRHPFLRRLRQGFRTLRRRWTRSSHTRRWAEMRDLFKEAVRVDVLDTQRQDRYFAVAVTDRSGEVRVRVFDFFPDRAREEPWVEAPPSVVSDPRWSRRAGEPETSWEDRLRAAWEVAGRGSMPLFVVREADRRYYRLPLRFNGDVAAFTLRGGRRTPANSAVGGGMPEPPGSGLRTELVAALAQRFELQIDQYARNELPKDWITAQARPFRVALLWNIAAAYYVMERHAPGESSARWSTLSLGDRDRRAAVLEEIESFDRAKGWTRYGWPSPAETAARSDAMDRLAPLLLEAERMKNDGNARPTAVRPSPATSESLLDAPRAQRLEYDLGGVIERLARDVPAPYFSGWKDLGLVDTLLQIRAALLAERFEENEAVYGKHIAAMRARGVPESPLVSRRARALFREAVRTRWDETRLGPLGFWMAAATSTDFQERASDLLESARAVLGEPSALWGGLTWGPAHWRISGLRLHVDGPYKDGPFGPIEDSRLIDLHVLLEQFEAALAAWETAPLAVSPGSDALSDRELALWALSNAVVLFAADLERSPETDEIADRFRAVLRRRPDAALSMLREARRRRDPADPAFWRRSKGWPAPDEVPGGLFFFKEALPTLIANKNPLSIYVRPDAPGRFNPLLGSYEIPESGEARTRQVLTALDGLIVDLEAGPVRSPNAFVYRLARLWSRWSQKAVAPRLERWHDDRARRLGLWGLTLEVPLLLVGAVALGPVGASVGFAAFAALHVLLEALERARPARGPPRSFAAALAGAFQDSFRAQFAGFLLSYGPLLFAGPAAAAVAWAVISHALFDWSRLFPRRFEALARSLASLHGAGAAWMVPPAAPGAAAHPLARTLHTWQQIVDWQIREKNLIRFHRQPVQEGAREAVLLIQPRRYRLAARSVLRFSGPEGGDLFVKVKHGVEEGESRMTVSGDPDALAALPATGELDANRDPLLPLLRSVLAVNLRFQEPAEPFRRLFGLDDAPGRETAWGLPVAAEDLRVRHTADPEEMDKLVAQPTVVLKEQGTPATAILAEWIRRLVKDEKKIVLLVGDKDLRDLREVLGAASSKDVPFLCVGAPPADLSPEERRRWLSHLMRDDAGAVNGPIRLDRGLLIASGLINIGLDLDFRKAFFPKDRPDPRLFDAVILVGLDRYPAVYPLVPIRYAKDRARLIFTGTETDRPVRVFKNREGLRSSGFSDRDIHDYEENALDWVLRNSSALVARVVPQYAELFAAAEELDDPALWDGRWRKVAEDWPGAQRWLDRGLRRLDAAVDRLRRVPGLAQEAEWTAALKECQSEIAAGFELNRRLTSALDQHHAAEPAAEVGPRYEVLLRHLEDMSRRGDEMQSILAGLIAAEESADIARAILHERVLPLLPAEFGRGILARLPGSIGRGPGVDEPAFAAASARLSSAEARWAARDAAAPSPEDLAAVEKELRAALRGVDGAPGLESLFESLSSRPDTPSGWESALEAAFGALERAENLYSDVWTAIRRRADEGLRRLNVEEIVAASDGADAALRAVFATAVDLPGVDLDEAPESTREHLRRALDPFLYLMGRSSRGEAVGPDVREADEELRALIEAYNRDLERLGLEGNRFYSTGDIHNHFIGLTSRQIRDREKSHAFGRLISSRYSAVRQRLRPEGRATVPLLASAWGGFIERVSAHGRSHGWAESRWRLFRWAASGTMARGVRFYYRNAWFFEGVIGAGTLAALGAAAASLSGPGVPLEGAAAFMSALFLAAHLLGRGPPGYKVGWGRALLVSLLYGEVFYALLLGVTTEDPLLATIRFLAAAPLAASAWAVHFIISRGYWPEPAERGKRKYNDAVWTWVGRGAAAVLLPFAVLLIAAQAPFVKIGSPGRLFFRHERAGHDGRRFWALKLRSMQRRPRPDAPAIPSPYGRVVRPIGLDEIPQIFSILTGESRWFGARYTPSEIQSLDPEGRLFAEAHAGLFSTHYLTRERDLSAEGKHRPIYPGRLESDLRDWQERSVAYRARLFLAIARKWLSNLRLSAARLGSSDGRTAPPASLAHAVHRAAEAVLRGKPGRPAEGGDSAARWGLWGLTVEIPALAVGATALGPVAALIGLGAFVSLHAVLEAVADRSGRSWGAALARSFGRTFRPQFLWLTLAYAPIAMTGGAGSALAWAVFAHLAYDLERLFPRIFHAVVEALSPLRGFPGAWMAPPAPGGIRPDATLLIRGHTPEELDAFDRSMPENSDSVRKRYIGTLSTLQDRLKPVRLRAARLRHEAPAWNWPREKVESLFSAVDSVLGLGEVERAHWFEAVVGPRGRHILAWPDAHAADLLDALARRERDSSERGLVENLLLRAALEFKTPLSKAERMAVAGALLDAPPALAEDQLNRALAAFLEARREQAPRPSSRGDRASLARWVHAWTGSPQATVFPPPDARERGHYEFDVAEALGEGFERPMEIDLDHPVDPSVVASLIGAAIELESEFFDDVTRELYEVLDGLYRWHAGERGVSIYVFIDLPHHQIHVFSPLKPGDRRGGEFRPEIHTLSFAAPGPIREFAPARRPVNALAYLLAEAGRLPASWWRGRDRDRETDARRVGLLGLALEIPALVAAALTLSPALFSVGLGAFWAAHVALDFRARLLEGRGTATAVRGALLGAPARLAAMAPYLLIPFFPDAAHAIAAAAVHLGWDVFALGVFRPRGPPPDDRAAGLRFPYDEESLARPFGSFALSSRERFIDEAGRPATVHSISLMAFPETDGTVGRALDGLATDFNAQPFAAAFYETPARRRHWTLRPYVVSKEAPASLEAWARALEDARAWAVETGPFRARVREVGIDPRSGRVGVWVDDLDRSGRPRGSITLFTPKRALRPAELAALRAWVRRHAADDFGEWAVDQARLAQFDDSYVTRATREAWLPLGAPPAAAATIPHFERLIVRAWSDPPVSSMRDPPPPEDIVVRPYSETWDIAEFQAEGLSRVPIRWRAPLTAARTVLLLGPGRNADEIDVIRRRFPYVREIHIVDLIPEFLAEQDRLLAERPEWQFNAEGEPIAYYAWRVPMARLPEALNGAVDVVFDHHVLDQHILGPAGVAAVARSLARAMKPGGFHVSFVRGSEPALDPALGPTLYYDAIASMALRGPPPAQTESSEFVEFLHRWFPDETRAVRIADIGAGSGRTLDDLFDRSFRGELGGYAPAGNSIAMDLQTAWPKGSPRLVRGDFLSAAARTRAGLLPGTVDWAMTNNLAPGLLPWDLTSTYGDGASLRANTVDEREEFFIHLLGLLSVGGVWTATLNVRDAARHHVSEIRSWIESRLVRTGLVPDEFEFAVLAPPADFPPTDFDAAGDLLVVRRVGPRRVAPPTAEDRPVVASAAPPGPWRRTALAFAAALSFAVGGALAQTPAKDPAASLAPLAAPAREILNGGLVRSPEGKRALERFIAFLNGGGPGTERIGSFATLPVRFLEELDRLNEALAKDRLIVTVRGSAENTSLTPLRREGPSSMTDQVLRVTGIPPMTEVRGLSGEGGLTIRRLSFIYTDRLALKAGLTREVLQLPKGGRNLILPGWDVLIDRQFPMGSRIVTEETARNSYERRFVIHEWLHRVGGKERDAILGEFVMAPWAYITGLEAGIMAYAGPRGHDPAGAAAREALRLLQGELEPGRPPVLSPEETLKALAARGEADLRRAALRAWVKAAGRPFFSAEAVSLALKAGLSEDAVAALREEEKRALPEGLARRAAYESAVADSIQRWFDAQGDSPTARRYLRAVAANAAPGPDAPLTREVFLRLVQRLRAREVDSTFNSALAPLTAEGKRLSGAAAGEHARGMALATEVLNNLLARVRRDHLDQALPLSTLTAALTFGLAAATATAGVFALDGGWPLLALLPGAWATYFGVLWSGALFGARAARFNSDRLRAEALADFRRLLPGRAVREGAEDRPWEGAEDRPWEGAGVALHHVPRAEVVARAREALADRPLARFFARFYVAASFPRADGGVDVLMSEGFLRPVGPALRPLFRAAARLARFHEAERAQSLLNRADGRGRWIFVEPLRFVSALGAGRRGLPLAVAAPTPGALGDRLGAASARSETSGLNAAEVVRELDRLVPVESDGLNAPSSSAAPEELEAQREEFIAAFRRRWPSESGRPPALDPVRASLPLAALSPRTDWAAAARASGADPRRDHLVILPRTDRSEDLRTFVEAALRVSAGRRTVFGIPYGPLAQSQYNDINEWAARAKTGGAVSAVALPAGAVVAGEVPVLRLGVVARELRGVSPALISVPGSYSVDTSGVPEGPYRTAVFLLLDALLRAAPTRFLELDTLDRVARAIAASA